MKFVSRRKTSSLRLNGFTLIELLVVIAIIGLLVSILVPSLTAAKRLAKQVTCLTRVGGQLRAIHMFTADNDGDIPTGPGDQMQLPGGFAGPPMNQIASNQIWIGAMLTYNAHGELLDNYMKNEKMMFCPADDTSDPKEELEKIEDRQAEDAYSSYMYRQLDGRASGGTGSKLEDLGANSAGGRVSALVMDMNSLLQIPGVPQRTNHRGEKVNVGFAGGNAETFDNSGKNFTLRAGDEMNVFGRLDEILEYADQLGR